MTRYTGAIAGAVALAVAGVATGEDVAPPDYRGSDASTTQEWDFVSQGSSGIPGEVYYDSPDGTSGITNNPYGTSSGSVLGPSGAGWKWEDGTGPGPGGAWVNFGSMGFYVPNSGVWGDTWKDLRLQVTFCDPGGDRNPPEVEVTGRWGECTETLVDESIVDLADENWHVLVQDWLLRPNPDAESVSIDNPFAGESTGYAVSEVVIDTVCVPEPASAAVLAAGGLALAIRRRRKR